MFPIDLGVARGRCKREKTEWEGVGGEEERRGLLPDDVRYLQSCHFSRSHLCYGVEGSILFGFYSVHLLRFTNSLSTVVFFVCVSCRGCLSLQPQYSTHTHARNLVSSRSPPASVLFFPADLFFLSGKKYTF